MAKCRYPNPYGPDAVGTVAAVAAPEVLDPVPAARASSDADADDAAARRRRALVLLTRVLSVVVVVCMVSAAYRLRGTLGDAVVALTSLPFETVAAVLGCWAVIVAARAALYRWSLPQATLRQGVVLDQVNLAVSNAVPGGALPATALRYRIARSFRHAPDEIALSILAVGEAMSVGRWLLVVAVLAGELVVGQGTGVDGAVLVTALAALVASGLLWGIGSRDIPLTRWADRTTQTILDRAGRRVRLLRGVRVAPFTSGVRHQAGWVLRERAGRLVALGALVTVGGATLVVLVVQAVGGPDAPGTWDVVRVYLLARLVAGFSPTPGGVGVVEGALGAGLVAAGADPAAAVAAVLVYRGLTYALPIATGSAVYLGWRRWDRRRRFAPVAGPEDPGLPRALAAVTT